MNNPLRNKLFGAVGLVILLALVAVAAWSFRQNKTLQDQLATLQEDPNLVAKNELQEVKTTVGQLMVLPEGEEPTLATVSDKEKLSDVSFFTGAENGDKVLIYVNARKAILYRPSQQKIVEVATINASTSPTPTAANFAPKVALRNGTTVAGLTGPAEAKLKQAIGKATVVTKDNAKQSSFTETIVVDLSGNQPGEAAQVAAVFNAKVASLPAGEAKPAGAEFLVILGTDQASGQPASTTTPSPKASPEQSSDESDE